MRTSIRRKHSFLAGLLALALALTACAPDVGDDDEAATEEPIRLAANPWPGSFANAAVAKVIMEDELDLNVEIVEIDQTAQWPGLSEGEIDAALEVWVDSGQREEMEEYVERGTIEEIGPLGAIGLIGWFTPSYVLDEYPEFETWEGLEGNEHVFDTPETSGDSGQFLAADPSFTQRDEHIIENLGLDLQVIQSGSEAAQLTEVESAIDNEEPILFYFYTPHWAFNQWDLSEIELPEPTEECLELPEEERDCGYPDDVLAKVVNTDLEEKSSTAYQFIDNFHMENEWQDELTFMIDVEEMEPVDAAREWLSENEERWQDWLP